MRKMTTLCGLSEIKSEINGFVKKASLYRTLGKKPPALIVYLSQNQGRTTVADYVVDCFAESRLLDFTYAIEELLELDFDGSYSNCTGNIETLEDNADFANDYANVCAISGLEKLASHFGETQIDIFLDMIDRVEKSGYLIVFASANPKSMEVKLLEKVKDKLSSFVEVTPSAYIMEDYANAIKAYLEDLGVIVNGNVTDIPDLDSPDLTMVKAIEIADKAVMEAEFVNGTPVLTIEVLKQEREVK